MDPECRHNQDQNVIQEPIDQTHENDPSSQNSSMPETTKSVNQPPTPPDSEGKIKMPTQGATALVMRPSSEEQTQKDPLPQNSSMSNNPKPFSLFSTPSNVEEKNNMLIQGAATLIMRPSYQNPVIIQPRSDLQSPMSIIMPGLPPSLFLQALNKLSESSNITEFNKVKTAMENHLNESSYQEGDITPPDSLTSAPPSYSFVLRQMTARRRPRLMGTFIPSPSFVQHTPPPTYATAFDIYVDNRIRQPTPRMCNFGFASTAAVCPECGYTGMTLVTSKITLCTHMSAFILCLFCCWICAPLPYILRSCKDVYHYCRNCRTFLGMYCPTSPESNYN